MIIQNDHIMSMLEFTAMVVSNENWGVSKTIGTSRSRQGWMNVRDLPQEQPCHSKWLFWTHYSTHTDLEVHHLLQKVYVEYWPILDLSTSCVLPADDETMCLFQSWSRMVHYIDRYERVNSRQMILDWLESFINLKWFQTQLADNFAFRFRPVDVDAVWLETTKNSPSVLRDENDFKLIMGSVMLLLFDCSTDDNDGWKLWFVTTWHTCDNPSQIRKILAMDAQKSWFAISALTF